MSEQRLRMLTTFPSHITSPQLSQTGGGLVQHYPIQSIFPSSLGMKIASQKPTKPKKSPVIAVQAAFVDSRAVLGQEDVEAGIVVTDDLFLMEGVDSAATQLRSQDWSHQLDGQGA